MAWRRPGGKPLSEPMMVRLLTHICVTRPQWVKQRLQNFVKRVLRKWFFTRPRCSLFNSLMPDDAHISTCDCSSLAKITVCRLSVDKPLTGNEMWECRLQNSGHFCLCFDALKLVVTGRYIRNRVALVCIFQRPHHLNQHRNPAMAKSSRCRRASLYRTFRLPPPLLLCPRIDGERCKICIYI